MECLEYQEDLAGEGGEDVFCVTHCYDMADMRVFIKRSRGCVDAFRAAAYCQFMCELWFGPHKILTNLGVASLMVALYGYQQTVRMGQIMPRAQGID